MSKVLTKDINSRTQYSKIQDYKMLVKFRLTLMVVGSSVLSYLVAAGTSIDWLTLCLLAIGGFTVTGAANGINQVLEREYDAMMTRTMNRPLAANRMKPSEAVMSSGLLLVFGVICLGIINPLTAFIGMCSFVLYAFLYTPMKRYSTLSVAIGAIPGALPVLIGVVAHSGTITILGIVLFFIQFLWQFPHFWAIAYLSFEDYNEAGYKLLPKNSEGRIDRNLGLYSAIYALLILPTILIGYLNGFSIALWALIAVCVVTIIYALMAIRLQVRPSRSTALGLMFSSFFYLPIVLLLYLIG